MLIPVNVSMKLVLHNKYKISTVCAAGPGAWFNLKVLNYCVIEIPIV